MNIEKNQQFRSADALSVLGLMGIVIAIFVTVFSDSYIEQKENIANERAKQLAIQIASGGYKGLQSEMNAGFSSIDRAPASVVKIELKPEGRIGMDPWGSPYFYTLQEDGEGRRHVVVVSSGPNRNKETQIMPVTEDFSNFGRVLARGDDVVSYIQR